MEVSVTATAQVANLFGAEVTIPANYTIAGADLVVVILGQNNSSAMNTPTTRTLNIRQKINVA